MTKIYVYCLFDMDEFVGAYSSLKAIHRDALKLSNRGYSGVYLVFDNKILNPSLTSLRNAFKGKCDIDVKYRTDNTYIRVHKTKLKE
jgi:hypothetical protein|tara:strand:+ start:373 stop:633 length:261 start_codon:yes stop_codon:yes gene_type:complete